MESNIKMINSLSKTDDFTKTHKFIIKKHYFIKTHKCIHKNILFHKNHKLTS